MQNFKREVVCFGFQTPFTRGVVLQATIKMRWPGGACGFCSVLCFIPCYVCDMFVDLGRNAPSFNILCESVGQYRIIPSKF